MSENIVASRSGRPRDGAIDEQILSAARAILEEGGYKALTFEAIAGRTGIGRPTIYRRWPSKAHLAAHLQYDTGEDLHDSGHDLVGQMRVLVDQLSQNYRRSEIAASSVGLISEYHDNPELKKELQAPAERKARAQMKAIVSRLKRSGQIDAEADANLLFEMAVGAVIFRRIFSSWPESDCYEEELADRLCKAFRPDTSG